MNDMSPLQAIESKSDPQVIGTWTTRWGLLLRMARQVAGLSLNELAARSGLSKGYLSKLESAHPSAANPSRATLAALARALPSTLPLIQHLDPGDGLPPPSTVLQGSPLQTLGALEQQPPVEPPTTHTNSITVGGFLSGTTTSWHEWEFLLALIVFERGGLGPQTKAVLARACEVEGDHDDPLAHLEKTGIIQRLPPGQQGGECRYTLNQNLLNQQQIRRPADLFIYAAMHLLLRRGDNEDQRPGTLAARTAGNKKTVR